MLRAQSYVERRLQDSDDAVWFGTDTQSILSMNGLG